MVDFGATALAALHKLNQRSSEIDYFVFTHLHGDHLGGVPFLLIDSLYSDVRVKPLNLIGPVGLKKRINDLVAAAYEPSVLAPEKRNFVINVLELLPGEQTNIGSLKLTTFPADHQDPPEQPLCLQFSTQTTSVAFSGDTQICEGLMDAANNVDLLVAECSGLKHPIGRHCAWEDWEALLPKMTCKRLLLSHLNEQVRNQIPQLLAKAPSQGPRLDFADDGLVIEILPAHINAS